MSYNLKFICVQDFVMEDECFEETSEDYVAEVAFVKGTEYRAKEVNKDTYVFIDEQGDEHFMDKEDYEEYTLSDYLVILE